VAAQRVDANQSIQPPGPGLIPPEEQWIGKVESIDCLEMLITLLSTKLLLFGVVKMCLAWQRSCVILATNFVSCMKAADFLKFQRRVASNDIQYAAWNSNHGRKKYGSLQLKRRTKTHKDTDNPLVTVWRIIKHPT
jgi:hypothetical protein